MPNPLISIIIPTYNRAELLPRAINSVLKQTYQDFEIIIIDDRSTDNTKIITKQFIKKDKRIRYFLNTHKKGPGGARNQGMEKAKGSYIAFLDDDDEWLPFHLGECLDFFKGFPECSIVFSDIRYIKNNRIISNSSLQNKKQIHKIPFLSYREYRKFTTPIFSYLIEENFIPMQTVIIKKSSLNEYFDENILNGQDWEWMLRLARTKIGYINKIHCNVYIHNKNITSQTNNLERLLNELKKIWIKLLSSNLTKQDRKGLFKNISNSFFNIGYRFFLKNDFKKAKANYFKSLEYNLNCKTFRGLLIIYLLPHKFLIRYNKNRNE